MNLYTSDIFAQSTLLVDYLKGLNYLHNQKGVMHRDVNPNNLGVVSADPPRGILLDLDSATREDWSTDHMQGTLPYLAPEIIELKDRATQLAGTCSGSGALPGPVPYRNGVDVWAMGLSVFSLYTGHYFNWGLYNSKGTSRRIDKSINNVRRESYQHFKDNLRERRAAAGEDQAENLLDLVDRMTE